ncbi:MAG: diacylglycerol/lipid kinase family protein [Pseudomonadota bacterium]
MQTLWFITNSASGTATPAKCDALEAVFDERGLTLAGRSRFPDDPIPDADDLDAASVDTVVLFAGDGTINAALCHLAKWDGAFLILPGGTMNLLARALHASVDPHAIVHAAHERDRRVALPYIEAGQHRAFVGLILGPAANWFRPREEARKRRFRRIFSAVAQAWRRTFDSKGVSLAGAPELAKRYQAVFVSAQCDALDVAAVDARDWGSILQLGWEWVTGDWVAARAVTQVRTPRLWVRGHRPMLALFDGEPQRLAPGTEIRGGTSARTFLTTRGDGG